MRSLLSAFVSVGFALLLCSVVAGIAATRGPRRRDAKPQLELQPHDRIALVGNGLAERMRLYGNFEALLHTRFPEHELVVRNFGWPADEVGNQQRPNDYTAIDDPLTVFAPERAALLLRLQRIVRRRPTACRSSRKTSRRM